MIIPFSQQRPTVKGFGPFTIHCRARDLAQRLEAIQVLATIPSWQDVDASAPFYRPGLSRSRSPLKATAAGKAHHAG